MKKFNFYGKVRNLTEANTVTAPENTDTDFYLYDAIDDYYGVSSTDVLNFLKKAGQDTAVTIHINSPGGSFYEGLAIASLLRAHKGTVTCVVDALAASAASVVALAGDNIVMAQGSFLMIHNAWGIFSGFASDLRKEADYLDKICDSMAVLYSKHSGISLEEIKAMMDAETWFNAEEAVERGFAHGVSESKPKASASTFDLSCYAKAPKSLITVAEEQKKPEKLEETNENDEISAEHEACARRLKLFEFV